MTDKPQRGEPTTERWGGWWREGTLLKVQYTHRSRHNWCQHKIDLRSCLTPSGMLQQIMKVVEEPWATDKALAGLLRALNDLLDPRTNLLGEFGRGKKRLSQREIVAKLRSEKGES